MRLEFTQKPNGAYSNYPAIFKTKPFTAKNRVQYVKDIKGAAREFVGRGNEQRVNFIVDLPHNFPYYIVLKSTDPRSDDIILFTPRA